MTNDKKQSAAPEEMAPDMPKDPVINDDIPSAGETFLEDEPDTTESLLGEIADLKDKYIRLAADMENLRKRTEREKQETAKYAISDFAREILSLGDNIQRAIAAVPQEAAEQDEALKSFLEGVEMTERELQKVLERHGVSRLDPKGEKFDPNIHQAVQQVENAELPHDTVCDVYQVGYMISDRVLRPAVVSVAKGGPKAVPPANPEQDGAMEPPLTLKTAPNEAPGGESGPEEIGSTVDKNA